MVLNPSINYNAQIKIKFGGEINMGLDTVIDYGAMIKINGNIAKALRVERGEMDVYGNYKVIVTEDKVSQDDTISYNGNDYIVNTVLEDMHYNGVEPKTQYIAYCYIK